MARSIEFRNGDKRANHGSDSDNALLGCPKTIEILDTTTTTGGVFSISAVNNRGSIDINFGETPLNHTLHFDAATSFDDVKVAIPPTFEGNWMMKALHPFREIVDNIGSYKDPTGDGRDRVLWVDRETLFEQEGAVVWGRRMDKVRKGWVLLRSKFGRATLVL